MKAIISLLIVLTWTPHVQAQTKSYSIDVMPQVILMPEKFRGEVDTLKYYNSDDLEVGIKPVSGWYAFYDLLSTSRYPEEAKLNNEQAYVQVEFKVDRHGKLEVTAIFDQNYSDTISTCGSCIDLAKKVVEETKWVPAQIEGTKVNAIRNLILTFTIVESN